MRVINQEKNYTERVISAPDVMERLSSALNVENDSQLARAIGEKRSTVGNWRNRNLPTSTIISIARKHGISLDYLFCGGSSVASGDVKKANTVKPDSAPKVMATGETINDRLDRLQTTIEALVAMNEGDDEPPGTRPISVVEVQAAAGGGTVLDMEEVTGHVWFRRDWLDANAIDPKQSVVMKVKGESMEPVLMDGASILVDRARTRRRAGHIYVVRTDDGLVAKRLGRNRKGAWQLESAHPEYRPFAWDQLMTIVGEVRWTSRTLPTQRGI